MNGIASRSEQMRLSGCRVLQAGFLSRPPPSFSKRRPPGAKVRHPCEARFWFVDSVYLRYDLHVEDDGISTKTFSKSRRVWRYSCNCMTTRQGPCPALHSTSSFSSQNSFSFLQTPFARPSSMVSIGASPILSLVSFPYFKWLTVPNTISISSRDLPCVSRRKNHEYTITA